MNEPLYRIGEAAKLLELETYVLRFWETEFPQLEPLRTPKGQRLYSASHVALLHEVKRLLYDEGLTIEGARKSLDRREWCENTEESSATGHVKEPSSAQQKTTPQRLVPTLVQGSLIPGLPAPPRPPDQQLLLELRSELNALRETLRRLNAPRRPE